MKITADSLDELWCETIKQLVEVGMPHSSRDGDTYESLNANLILTDPTRIIMKSPSRKFSRRYAMAELLWYLSGAKEGWIKHYAPQYERFLDDGYAHGAYGWRMRMRSGDQLTKTIEMLKRDPDTRRAVMQFYAADIDLDATQKDIPCTLTLQFIVRQSHLHLIVSMRSNDAWLGLPNDVFCFAALQQIVAGLAGFNVGTYFHNAGSMHLYTRDFEKVNRSEIYNRSNTFHFASINEESIDLAVGAERALREGHIKSNPFGEAGTFEHLAMEMLLCDH
jgi:thymidylate synthase